MQEIPFLFAIPLLAKSVARDWGRVCGLLACTLDSILNQSDPNFRVVLVCHDVPDLPQLNDPRVEIILTQTAVPTSPGAQMVDKGHKKRLALSYLHRLGGGWIMLVDADDLVSRRLVEYVKNKNAPHGMLIDSGWEFDCATHKMTASARFNRVCGSSAIFRFSQSDLPVDAAQSGSTVADAFESHRVWREQAQALNRPMQMVDFRAAIYTINNQQNHSVLMGNIGWKRRLLRLISRAHAPTATEIAEFSMNGLLNL